MESIYNTVTHYLVHHPTIANFHWQPGTTPASTPLFLLLTLLTYLSLTFLLLKLRPPPPPPPLLTSLTLLHNLLILLLSLFLALSTSLSSLLTLSSPSHLLCLPIPTPPRGPLFFYAYLFYLSKLLEFIDTLLILLSGSTRRLSFLHVYHHATVVVMCYVWLETSQSLFPVALVTNTAVHTVMYAYYLACAAGARPKWKRAVTNLQIAQFVFSFLVSGGMLYLHFARGGCSGFYGWCFNCVFNVSLFWLFIDFHRKNYRRGGEARRDGKEKGL